MSLIGREISEFRVQSYGGGAFREVTKADVLGRWSIFFFYPADFTFVCPTELGDLADKYEEFQKLNCEIYSVSCDTHYVHKAWHDASQTIQKIQYPMLADPTGALARAFDVMIEEEGVAERGSFIVNPEGKIVAYEVIAGNVGRNAEELLRRLQASQFVYGSRERKPSSQALIWWDCSKGRPLSCLCRAMERSRRAEKAGSVQRKNER